MRAYLVGSSRTPTEDSLLTSDSGIYKCEARNAIDVTGIENSTEMFVYCKSAFSLYPLVLLGIENA